MSQLSLTAINGSTNHCAGVVSNNGGVGEIHVILGPMFAGKTTELLRRIKSEKNMDRYDLVACFLMLITNCFQFLFWGVSLITRVFSDLTQNFLSTCRRNVAMIKSSKDTRYAVDSVVSHDGVKFPCWALPDLACFRKKFGAEAYDQVL